jgi:3-oxoacyl-[acyl-carrier protein] reductase
MKPLQDKIALITGASRGIGAAIARRLAADGAHVVVNFASSPEPADKLVAEITAAGGRARTARADVADESAVAAMFDDLMRQLGRIDILVNNAGTWAGAPIDKVTLDHVQHLFRLNVFAPLLVAARAARHFPPSGGRIVNIASVAARVPMPDVSVYTATKAAVESLTRNWALELGPRGVTVNAVAPGTTATEAVAAAPDDFKRATIARTALGRMGTPQDVADVVAFLASDDARWVTGQVIEASGGYGQ